MKRLALLSLLILCGCGSQKLPKGSYELQFDDALWRSSQGLETDTFHITPRQKMLGDLVGKHLIGKSRKDVITMLGEPYIKMDPDGTGPSLSYPTGVERDSCMSIDSEWLLVYFGPSGKVIRYRIGGD
jgi:hypothetical protein